MRNKNASNDSKFLKSRHIESPDLSKMEFRHHDPKMKTTVFFTSQEAKDRYVERLNNPQAEPAIKSGGRIKKKSKA